MSPTSLLICVVRDQDALQLVDVLKEKEIPFTKLASTGGFWREGNTTFLIGVDDPKKEEAITLIREICKRREEVVESSLPVNEPIGPYIPQKIKIAKGGGVLFDIPIQGYERF
ncbi:MAG: hypothetical protein PWP04_1099 [Candidatus Atribacteria bacterium]|nr:hypothetical protein [Candidatus Atribacteria bacterium]